MDEKTKEILEKAAVVFMRYGVKSITMDDIARELGISKKTLYIHVKDKNDLVYKIIESKVHLDECACSIARESSDNAIEEFFSMRHFVLENIKVINPSLFMDLHKYHSDAWNLITQHKHEFVTSSIKENIKRGISEGLYREDIQIDIVARLILSSADLILEGKTFPWPEFNTEDVFNVMTRFQIRGLASDKGIEYLQKHISQNQ